MSVTIDNTRSLAPLALGAEMKARTPAAKSDDDAPSAAASGTRVNIGSTSAQMLGKSGAAGSPLDASKVAEIKQAISEGRIQVNAGAVSDNLIKFVSDLISSQQA